MTLHQTFSGALELRDIPPVFVDLLREVSRPAPAAGQAGHGRLFPLPAGEEAGDEALCSDWQELVHPGLEALFCEARETVAKDLANLRPGRGGGWILPLPAAHLEAWLSALNQIRLVLAEEHGFGEADLASSSLPDPDEARGRALLQMHLYGYLQEMILQRLP